MPGRTVNNVAAVVSSRKRTRHNDRSDDIVEEREEEVVQASSSLRRDSRKRARISDVDGGKDAARHIREVTTDASDDDDASMGDADHDDEPPATQYEIMRDNGFRHLENADEDDKRATQRIQERSMARQTRQRSRSDELNQAAENGILESITCINFMCHERLHCELGPLLNFIVGENGSGKSAILTAITLCLGGKASSTNRGGSLKSFVKEGREQSILTVKIKNQGHDAYQHDVYGNSIIVERHFSRSGSSAFKVKTETGRTISTKKSEVDEIVEYYCLQVDNPLNVLSQDNARQFLNTASASTKYRFFLQGVQLQQLDDDYRVIQDYLEGNEDREEVLQTRLESARVTFEKAKKLHDLVVKHEEMRRKARLYRKQLIWAQVTEQEQELEKYRGEFAAADGKVARAVEAAQEKAQLLEMEGEHLRRAQAALEEVRDEGDKLKDNVAEAEEKLNEANKEVSKILSDERDAMEHMKRAKACVTEYQKKIETEEKRLEGANEGVLAPKQKELEEAKEREQEILHAKEEAAHSVPELERREAAASAECKQLDEQVEQKRNEITSVENKIHDLVGGQRSRYAAYEAGVPQLIRMIEHDAEFQEKPIGPVGVYVQITQPIWAPILESTFGEKLNGFIVTSKRDQQRLLGMTKRLKIDRCPIIITQSKSIDTYGREPDEQFDTILRILKIDNPVVRAQLIIDFRIEQIILVQEKKRAESIMMDGSARPRNVAACIHLTERRGEGVRLTARPDGSGFGSSPINPPGHWQKPRLRADSDREIPFLKESLELLRGEYDELNGKVHAARQAIQRCKKDRMDHKRASERLDQRLREVRVEIDRIQEELDAFDGVDGRLETLRRDIEDFRSSYESYGGQVGDLYMKKQEQRQLVEELKNQHKEAKGQMETFQERLHKAENKVRRLEDVYNNVVSEKNTAFEEIEMCKEDKTKAAQMVQKLTERVADFTEQASAACERVYIAEGETRSSVEKKWETLRKALDQREKAIGMTDDQVISQAREAKEALIQGQKAVEQVRKENMAMKSTLGNRLDKWRKFQRYISSNSRANFMYLLSEREFRGRLILDHEQKKLEVQVEPDKTRRNASARNTKTLSGGEKSFSSICLLLAIWEAMGSPLRCLDEFDVFMDNVNRAISTNMLISAARNSVGRQYILITPNAIEGRATLEKDVKIIRLTDPRQRRLTDP